MSHMLNAPSRLPRLLRRLAADRRGVTAVVTAISLVVLLGFAGLAIDVGKWLNATRSIQAVADQAAYSAALASGTNGCSNSAAAVTQATAIAAARGYVDGQNGVTLSIPPCSNNTFTVHISQVQPMWFSRLFLAHAPTASGQATARLASQASNLCVLAIDGTNPSENYTGGDANALYVTGSASVDVQCGIAVDSSSANSLEAGSNAASLTATNFYMVGDDQPTSNGFTPSITATGCSTCSPAIPANQILRNQLPVSDPYANRVVPSHHCPANAAAVDVGNNLTTSKGNGTPTGSGVGTFCGGLSLSGNVTVACGTYIVAGGSLSISNTAKVAQDSSCSSGVTFILTNSNPGAGDWANIQYNGNPSSSLVLTAPTSGPYGGLVFFQDRGAPNPNTSSGNTNNTQCGAGAAQNKIAGGGSQVVTGAIYFPSQVVCYGGGSTSNNANKCTQLIAFNLAFVGSSGLKSQCAGVGITPVSVQVPQLIK
jgi:Putative Flp pilus-assembly TadE/G-like